MRRSKKGSVAFAAQSIPATSVGLAADGFRQIIRLFGRQWGLHVLLPAAIRPPAGHARHRLRNPTFPGPFPPENVGFLNSLLADQPAHGSQYPAAANSGPVRRRLLQAEAKRTRGTLLSHPDHAQHQRLLRCPAHQREGRGSRRRPQPRPRPLLGRYPRQRRDVLPALRGLRRLPVHGHRDRPRRRPVRHGVPGAVGHLA